MIQNIYINERKLIINKDRNINNILNHKKPISKQTVHNYNELKEKNIEKQQTIETQKNIEIKYANKKMNEIPNNINLSYKIPYLNRCIKEIEEPLIHEPTIPKHIFQTWHTLELPTRMRNITTLLQELNPEFKYFLYDDTMCRDFIIDYFDNDVLYAFDTLIPGAYKSDLWRLCILYVYGGIYLDIKYINAPNFKFIELLDKEYFVRDYHYGVYQALLICLPKNEILMKCINHIVYNVKNKLYLNNALEITGPQLVSKYFTREQINHFNLHLSTKGILYNYRTILTGYPEYSGEQRKNELFPHYSIMWANRKVYKIENKITDKINTPIIYNEQKHTTLPISITS
jgi:mannosyltransferase OCH1-like enzyme